MKVSLISFTDDALNLLLTTKNTRLSYDDDPHSWTEEKKAEHLSYMLQSIKSSFEFIDYVFKIEGVTRAFTHEFVRHRHGSYAQQSMRVVDAREAEVMMPESVIEGGSLFYSPATIWEVAVEHVQKAYGSLIDHDIPIQDARGLLPTNVTTSIIAKFNLRTLHEMMKMRLCTRVATEFQDVCRAMRELVIFHHPWAEEFLQVYCVAQGTCLFPRYGEKECPVYFSALDNRDVRQTAKTIFWSVRHTATPVAKEGKAV